MHYILKIVKSFTWGFGVLGFWGFLAFYSHLRKTHNLFSVLGFCLGFKGEPRSEEHTSELQSRTNLVCRLLLEKKKKT